MKLVDLNPKWVGAGGEGVFRKDPATGVLWPTPERHGIGVSFDCPCGKACLRAFVAFSNPLDGGGAHISPGQPTWERKGEAFETLTLTPSIQRLDNCRWHGFITNGEVRPC